MNKISTVARVIFPEGTKQLKSKTPQSLGEFIFQPQKGQACWKQEVL